MVWLLLLLLVLLSIVGAALLFGGEPERYGAIIIGLSFVLGLVRREFVGLRTVDTDPFGLSIDILAFAGLVAIALYARRVWPIWASSLQLLAVTAHLARAFEISIMPLAYGLMRAAPTYIIWIVLAFATLNHMRTRRVGVNLPAWKRWSPR